MEFEGFEGSEKKITIVAREADLIRLKPAFWQEATQLAGARILSQVSNAQLTAYLLSESSLFVWSDRLTMITCGRTSLVRTASFLIDQLGSENIDLLTFERRNENDPHSQETDFFNDAAILKKKYHGQTLKFGSMDGNHLLLFYGERDSRPKDDRRTLKIVMYNAEVRGLDGIFPDFQVDDHHFEPSGYSANAIRGAEYYTVHVTPESHGSYVSFESNASLGKPTEWIVGRVVDLFKPKSFDVSVCRGRDVEFSTYHLKSGDPVLATSYGRNRPLSP